MKKLLSEFPTKVLINIINNIKDKSNIWNVNTEKEYHEENK